MNQRDQTERCFDRCLRDLARPKERPLTLASFAGRVPTMPSDEALRKLAALDALMLALLDSSR